MLKVRTKQLEDISVMLLEEEKLIDNQLRKNRVLKETKGRLVGNLKSLDEDLQKILNEKELLFSKLSTANKEKASMKPKGKGWFSGLRSGISNLMGGGGKKKDFDDGFIATSTGKVAKQPTAVVGG